MRARPTLLRLLLCLALVLNGIAGVHAGVRMAFDAGAPAAATAHEDAPCHDDMAALHGDAAEQTPPSADDDCCASAGCLCSCVASTPLPIAIQAIALTPLPDPRPVSPLRVSHASPTLPHLIRPPIG